jgi:hypothetical protein
MDTRKLQGHENFECIPVNDTLIIIKNNKDA